MAEPKDPEDRRHATMADVAKVIGVSRQLVSLAFRGEPGVGAETAAKIFAAAEQIGYSPNLAAQSLRREGSRYIGVAFHTSHSSSEELIPAIYKEAESRGFKIVLSAVSDKRSDEDAMSEIIGHRCDGVILISSTLPTSRLKQIAQNLPVVSLSRRVTGVNCGIVASEGESGIADAVNYLIGLGHREIAYVDTSAMYDHEFRLQGYKDAMSRSGLTWKIQSISGDYIESAGAEAAFRFLASEELPTAIICSNDQVALGLVYSLQKKGVTVPEQVSVVGFDDTVARLPYLDFTTVHQDATELARAAVADLQARINGEITHAQTHLTSATLVIRSSTGKPRQ